MNQAQQMMESLGEAKMTPEDERVLVTLKGTTSLSDSQAFKRLAKEALGKGGGSLVGMFLDQQDRIHVVGTKGAVTFLRNSDGTLKTPLRAVSTSQMVKFK